MHRALLAAAAACALALSVARAEPSPQPAPDGAGRGEDAADEEKVADMQLVEEVVVSSDIARDREAPAGFTTLERADITERNHGQDLGMLLGDTPNAWAYSDAGNGVGYSYLSLRGFGQQRIAVNINGVPLNTPEGRQVYHVDLADFAASADRIQVQRGTGTALVGSPAVGGVVSVDTGSLDAKSGGELSVGAGSFGTYRLSIRYGGAVGSGPWAWMVRAAHIQSDGYRDPSWTRHSLVHVAFQRSAPDSLWRINLFGGPEQTQLAYYGVPKEYLGDSVLRRTNFLRPGETDTFFQPQLQILNDRKIRDGIFLKNTLYAIVGSGYYRQFSDTLAYDPLGSAPPTPQYPESTVQNAWRQRSLSNRQVGWIPRVTWDHAGGTLTGGLEMLYHTGRHYGDVYQGEVCLDGPGCQSVAPVTSELPLYDFTNRKITATAFARETLRPSSRVLVNLELQATRHEYAMRHDEVRGYSWDAAYGFLSTRIGVNWNFTDRWNVWGQASRGSTEPYFNNVWDPEDTGSNPVSRFNGYDPSKNRFSDPNARPEKLTAYEAGVGYLAGAARFELNFYRMDFRDEFVFAGGVDQDGVPITENAGRSLHQGIEVEATGRLPGKVDVSGYAALSRDELSDYTILSPLAAGGTLAVDYSGNRVALFPESLVRLRVARSVGPARLELGARRVGTIYTDNSQNERRTPAVRDAAGYVDKEIDPFVLVDFAASVDLTRALHGRGNGLALRIQVENLTDCNYAAMGYSYPQDDTYTTFYTEFFPGATRSFYVGLTYGF